MSSYTAGQGQSLDTLDFEQILWSIGEEAYSSYKKKKNRAFFLGLFLNVDFFKSLKIFLDYRSNTDLEGL